MKTQVPLLSAALWAVASITSVAAPANSSFETTAGDRPKGWRVFTTPPEVAGDYYVSAGSEGDDAKTGGAALQFALPDGNALAQAVWLSDPGTIGLPAEPGRYACTFWVRARGLAAGNHVWVTLTGYAADNARIDEVARSGYLGPKELPEDEWTQIRFTFEVPDDAPYAKISPSVVFKTDPGATENPVDPQTRVLVDDLEISRE